MKHKIKCIAAVALAVLCVNIPSVFAMNDNSKHLLASAAFGAGAESLLLRTTETGPLSRLFYATVLGAMPGLAKEIIDHNRHDNHFSDSDMRANLYGSFGGAALSLGFNSLVKIGFEGDDYETFKISVEWKF